jgi:GNAT superfamily N-acetyltransferase
VIRPLTEDDVPAVYELMVGAFEHFNREHGLPVHPRPNPAVANLRLRHLILSDPDGAQGAEHDGRLVSAGLALKREGIWGLSLLVTDPEHQSGGVGSAVLRACHDYAADARGRVILSSTDPRAIRAYARLGLDAQPSITGAGTPRDVAAPDGVRDGDHTDLAFTAEVDRHVRGGAHGDDIDVLLRMGMLMLVSERGYAVYGASGEVRLLAAYDEEGASEILRAVLARVEQARVGWLTARQQWAIRVCVQAGLELSANEGPVFTGGDVGPFSPYIPSGAFL